MPKGQQRSNREKRKPKQDKPKKPAAATNIFAAAAEPKGRAPKR